MTETYVIILALIGAVRIVEILARCLDTLTKWGYKHEQR